MRGNTMAKQLLSSARFELATPHPSASLLCLSRGFHHKFPSSQHRSSLLRSSFSTRAPLWDATQRPTPKSASSSGLNQSFSSERTYPAFLACPLALCAHIHMHSTIKTTFKGYTDHVVPYSQSWSMVRPSSLHLIYTRYTANRSGHSAAHRYALPQRTMEYWYSR